jgi:hypothetical protein
MEDLLVRLQLAERPVEGGDELKPEQRLDSRQHHTGLLDGAAIAIFSVLSGSAGLLRRAVFTAETSTRSALCLARNFSPVIL